MKDAFPILVSTHWLAENLHKPNLVVLDASRHLPAAKRDPRAEFQAGHIPGARFLDLASLTDTGSSVPAALATAGQLATRMAQLGIGECDDIVLYDDSAVKTAARGWFTFEANGIKRVAILDGGLAKWREEGRPLASGPVDTAPAPRTSLGDASGAASGVATKAEMLANLDSRASQVLDARGADRVFGTGIDPVHGGENGRIPGSLNLPFGEVLHEDGTFKSPEDLRVAFAQAGVDMDAPLITTCGSGVTASVLLFAARLAGKADVRLYDGSWMEWEADPATPKVQGPA